MKCVVYFVFIFVMKMQAVTYNIIDGLQVLQHRGQDSEGNLEM
jgi:glutamine phosphoribosylpyrophosphate amidotransferase